MDGSILFILSVLLIGALAAVFIGVMTKHNKDSDTTSHYTSLSGSGTSSTPPDGFISTIKTGGGSSGGGFSGGSFSGGGSSGGGSGGGKSTGAPTPPAPDQNTIFAYRPRPGTALCPRCDGENDIGASLCHICGQSLSTKGAY